MLWFLWWALIKLLLSKVKAQSDGEFIVDSWLLENRNRCRGSTDRARIERLTGSPPLRNPNSLLDARAPDQMQVLGDR
ncbi:hypothetical protein SH449x_003295 [Pirellulaceae bacterium SH449]